MLCLILQASYTLARDRCYIQSDNEYPDKILSPLVTTDINQLPSSLFWGNVNGVNYLTTARNQHIPEYCGSCWAMAVTSALSDRIMIARNATWPEVNLAPQVLLSCNTDNQGCHGGNTLGAYKFISENGITDETCSIYQSRGHNNGLECSDSIWCRTCDELECRVPERYTKYYVEEYGRVYGELDIIRELQRGPIVCSIDANNAFHSYKKGVFSDNETQIDINHAISIVGYGEENGIPYWICRNSFGMYWGEDGIVRIFRGNNTIGIEQHCVWALPALVPTVIHSSSSIHPISSVFNSSDDLPVSWDWRNVSDLNYLSWNKNQNLPQYLQSSWAQAATSSLSDRLNILRNSTYPRISLSSQMLLFCLGKQNGTVLDVYEFGKNKKIVDDTCVQYIAQQPIQDVCTPIQICSNCIRPAPEAEEHSTCQAVTNYTLYYVTEYGSLSGVQNMKDEIYKRGPITCRIEATDSFYRYSGGVYYEDLNDIHLNHDVSIVGWGINYWIGRNSWGNYWGESGFFRIRMHENNLGIEQQCTWGMPSLSSS